MQTEPSFEHDSPRLSRRITLQWLAAAAAWSGIPAEALALPTVSAQGYGTDPVLVKPSTGPWRRILSRSQLVLLSRLADLILPPENGEPAPSRVGIAEFIDEWVSAPYPTQTADRSIVLAGLAAMERRAMQRYHQPVSAPVGHGPGRAARRDGGAAAARVLPAPALPRGRRATTRATPASRPSASSAAWRCRPTRA